MAGDMSPLTVEVLRLMLLCQELQGDTNSWLACRNRKSWHTLSTGIARPLGSVEEGSAASGNIGIPEGRIPPSSDLTALPGRARRVNFLPTSTLGNRFGRPTLKCGLLFSDLLWNPSLRTPESVGEIGRGGEGG